MREPTDYEAFEQFAAEPPERRDALIWWELRRALNAFMKVSDAVTKMEVVVEEMEGFMAAETASRRNSKEDRDWGLKVMIACVGLGQLVLAVIIAAVAT